MDILLRIHFIFIKMLKNLSVIENVKQIFTILRLQPLFTGNLNFKRE